MHRSGWLVLGVAVAIAAASCTGPEGPAGMPGPAASAGAPGDTGATGPRGELASGTDAGGALPTSCLSPCHGFGGIVEQWKTSTHYATFIANLGGDEVSSWTGATACGNCHAVDALEHRLSSDVSTLAGGVVANLTSGELEYKHPTTGALTESTYAGSAKVAAVSCTTCHAVTAENDPHVTGKPWTPGSFPLRTPSGANDEVRLEKSPDTTAVVGMPAGKLGTSNTCVMCHRSRKDVTNLVTASNAISTFWGPHEGPHADVFSGRGGYHFAGKTYDSSTHQQKLACVDCHMPSVAANAGTPNHSFHPQLAACQSCHAGAKSFDVDGGQSQIRLALGELEQALSDAGWLTRASAAPYDALTPAQLADHAFADDKGRPGGAPLTADQAGALYNYFVLARGSALGVHNPKYTKQLIYDSFVAVKGAPPTSLARP